MSYRTEMETWNREEIPFSLIIVRTTDPHNAPHSYRGVEEDKKEEKEEEEERKREDGEEEEERGER